MQKTVYTCDDCKVEIGAKKHITLVFAAHTNASGIAVPPHKGQVQWMVYNKLNGRFLHFCKGKCIGAFFDKKLKEAK